MSVTLSSEALCQAGPNAWVAGDSIKSMLLIVSDLELINNALNSSTTANFDVISEKTAGTGVTIQQARKRVVAGSAATLAPSLLQSGSVITLAKADGVTVTLPACSAANIGVSYKFIVTVTETSVGYVINTTGTDVFIGGIYGTIATPDAANDAFFGASTAKKTITLNGSTTGGLIGSWIEVTCISATQWHVSGMTLGTGTIATPFSN